MSKKGLVGLSLVKRTPKEKVKKVHEMKTFDEVGKQSIEDIYLEIKEFNKEANGFFKVDTDSKRLVMQQAQPSVTEVAYTHYKNKITNTKSNVKSAEASYNKAEYELSDTEDTIDLEVRQAYLNMREAERRFNSTAMAVKQAEEDYFIATEKYKVGAGIILDVIDAELALSQARLNYASAQYDYARYKANLEYVIGTPKGETIDG